MAQTPRPRSERGVLHRAPEVFGHSVLGAPLEVFRAEREPTGLLVVGGVHGEEGESVTVLSAALRSLAAGDLACDVVLALNPDGLARGTRGNAHGVDLNRNLPVSTWAPEPVAYRWTLEEPRDVALSPGKEPASEPETRAFLDLAGRTKPQRILAVHAPLGLVDDPSDTALGAWLSERTGLERVGDVGYPTPGSLGTWGAEHAVEVVTLELPREATEDLVRSHAQVLMDVLTGVAR